MWMQILIAAGYPAFGEAFPRNWGDTIRDANPDGFHESLLRQGIYYATNPHPRTGAYFAPQQVEKHAVKIFIGGLVRTDLAFIGKVIATMRPWREYAASLQRLYAMEDEQREEGKEPPPRMDPVLEWWAENFGLIRDIATRRYPVHVQSYDGLLDDPPKVIRRTLKWLGAESDVRKAIAAVNPGNRTQKAPPSLEVETEHAEIFDLLYDTVHRGDGLTAKFIRRLNELNETLAPMVQAERQRVAEARRGRAR